MSTPKRKTGKPTRQSKAAAVHGALTPKQQAFIDEYFICGMNATEAAKRAGYAPRAAYAMGAENLKKPQIKEAIKARMEARTMEADEVLLRLTEQARASLQDFVAVDANGNYHFDLAQAARNGKVHLLKKIAFSKGRLEIELYDAQAALALLGKHYKLFTDRVELADWRSEAEQAGFDPDEVKRSLIAEAQRIIRESAGRPSR